VQPSVLKGWKPLGFVITNEHLNHAYLSSNIVYIPGHVSNIASQIKENSGDSQFIIHVEFEVLTAASMKMAVFWVVAPCSLVEVYQRFRGTYCLHHLGDDDGNVGKLPDYTALQPRRQPSSVCNTFYKLRRYSILCHISEGVLNTLNGQVKNYLNVGTFLRLRR
jgi:hypothetical protein